MSKINKLLELMKVHVGFSKSSSKSLSSNFPYFERINFCDDIFVVNKNDDVCGRRVDVWSNW